MYIMLYRTDHCKPLMDTCCPDGGICGEFSVEPLARCGTTMRLHFWVKSIAFIGN